MRRHRRLRAPLAGPVAVQVAHVDLLRDAVDDAPDPEPTPWSVPRTPGRALTALAASAQYPERPVKFIVPYAAGSGVDVAMRPVADAMARELGQAIVCPE